MASANDSDDDICEAYNQYLDSMEIDDDDLESCMCNWDHIALEQQHRDHPVPREQPMEIDLTIPSIPVSSDEQLGGGNVSQTPESLFQFRLGSILDRRTQRLGVHEQVVPVHLQQNRVSDPANHNLVQELGDALLHAVQSLLQRYESQGNPLHAQDRLYFTIGSQYLHSVYDGWNLTVGEWQASDKEPRVNSVLENLAKLLNSNQSFKMDKSFTLSLVIVRSLSHGGGKRRRRRHEPGEVTATKLPTCKRSIQQIPRDERNMCCASALWVAYKKKTLDARTFHAHYQATCRRRPTFRAEVNAFQNNVGIPLGTVCGPTELDKFAIYFRQLGYYIVVIDASRGYQGFRYGDGDDEDKVLGLLYNDNHYDVISSFKGFFCKNYCFKCLKTYDNQGLHSCSQNNDHCPRCLQDGCEDFVKFRQTLVIPPPGFKCTICSVSFFGPICYAQHSTKTYQGLNADLSHLSVCRTVQKCSFCGKRSVYHGRQMFESMHKCYHNECPSCLEYVNLTNHKCYIQTEEQLLERKQQRKQRRQQQASFRARARGRQPPSTSSNETQASTTEKITVYFDIESMQVSEEDNNTFRHVPNLVVAASEASDLKSWYGPHCIRDFVTWLDSLANDGSNENDDDDDDDDDDDESNSKIKLTVIAHNFQGYDSYFIIQEYQRQARNYRQIVNGGKILALKVGKNIRFIDSMSFLPMSLASFTTTFGLDEEDDDDSLNLKKGYFPHLFNTPDHQNYQGPVPAKAYYHPQAMSSERCGEFEQWYLEISNQLDYIFNFRNELLEYCASDVRLLRAGCEIFRQEFQALAGFDPFQHTTITSACSRDLRKSRLQRNTIASEPVNGWRLSTNHSLVSIEWLEWTGDQLGYPLKHARNEGEHTIRYGNKAYHVDGYDPITNKVYEFYGCFWHGCPDCYPLARHEPHQQLQGRSFDEVYHATLNRQRNLRYLGYHVECIWEHAWLKRKREHLDLALTIQSYNLETPLNPRDAFFGGRTNAVRLYAQDGVLKYYDFTPCIHG